jgi:iron complex outermembrane receptor protein
LRLESKAGSRLGWVLGAYYFKQHFNEHYYETVANANTVNTAIPGTTGVINNPIVGTPGGTSGPNPLSANFEQRNIENIRSKALFGNVTYDLSPTLRFDGGLRYTWDHKDATTNFRYVFFYPPFFAGDFSPLIHSASPRKNDQGVSGRAALAYRPNGKDQLYVAYSRGYLASAFTLGQGLPPNNIAKSEHLDVFEVGGNKSVGPLRFDGSIFYENLANQQIPVFAQLRTPGPNNTTILGTYTTLINAKRSEIYGAELQATWRPTTHSSLVASYTYLHPTFKSFCPALSTQSTCGVVDILGTNSPQSLSGNEIPRTPRNKASLYGYYGFNLGNAGFLYPGGSIAYQSGFYTQPFQIDRYHVPGRTIVGLTLTYRTPGEHLDVTGTVLNLFRKYYSDNGGVQIIGTTVDRSTTYGQDQYWTVTARYRF